MISTYFVKASSSGLFSLPGSHRSTWGTTVSVPSSLGAANSTVSLIKIFHRHHYGPRRNNVHRRRRGISNPPSHAPRNSHDLIREAQPDNLSSLSGFPT